MQVLSLTGEFTDEVLDNFIENYNKLKHIEPITIYLSSPGGLICVSNIILDIINKNKDNITLIGCDELQSAAFNLFFFAECNKVLLEGTYGMAHYAWTVVAVNESGKPTGESEKFILKELKDNKHIVIKKYKEIGINTTELKKIESGKNCYFTYSRLQELLNGKKN